MTGLVVFKNKVVVEAVPSPCAVSAANGAALVRLQLLLSHGFHQQCGLVARQRHGPSGGKHESHVPHDTSCMEARNPSNVIFDAFDFFTPPQPPARDDFSDVRVEAWR